ncbi:hypothetical protein Gotri_026742 [Gossypium trilobum]|uniref:Uncharacterized protein n=1 Tax=Gossypium trilobum TaxID=34281 RepID=A0A7J9FM97_9ROSI|nr:hypothetical protein [Gossypium trilobum]
MTVVESVVKIGLGKDKLRSSKFEERGICEKNHKEYVVNGNGNTIIVVKEITSWEEETQQEKGQVEMLSLRQSIYIEEMSEEIRA